MFEGVLGQDGEWATVAVAAGVVVILAVFAAEVSGRLARRLLERAGGAGARELSPAATVVPVRAVRLVVLILVAAALGSPVFEFFGARLPGMDLAVLSEWLLGPGLRVLLVLLLSYLLVGVVGVAVERLEADLQPDALEGRHALEDQRRAMTLGRLIRGVVTSAIVVVASLIVLRELNVDIMPILTGAGILGLAVGFGAQTLVKDVIAGFFLIAENQIRVGDVARINGTGGLVEAINIRTIVLRDLSGSVHVFPNGSIATLANLTKDFSYAVLDVGVAYKEDTDRVVELLREVATELASEDPFRSGILEPLEVLGVDDFGESQVTIKIRLKTVPLRQWEIGREFRRRIKKAFDAAGVEIPFPQISVHAGEASKPFQVRQVE